MDEAASQERRSPKRKRKLDTEVDFDAFARVGKQLQEDVVDLKVGAPCYRKDHCVWLEMTCICLIHYMPAGKKSGADFSKRAAQQ